MSAEGRHPSYELLDGNPRHTGGGDKPGRMEPHGKLSVSVWVPWALLQNSTSFSVELFLISS